MLMLCMARMNMRLSLCCVSGVLCTKASLRLRNENAASLAISRSRYQPKYVGLLSTRASAAKGVSL
jgi:hypothetical protein